MRHGSRDFKPVAARPSVMPPTLVGISAVSKPRQTARETSQGQASPYSQARAKTLELRPFKAFDVATLPPRSWLYGKHYQRKTVSLTAGPGGMGKSSEDLVEAIAMATARSLLGEQPGERLKCWYHNGEDNAQEIDRRIAAICLALKHPANRAGRLALEHVGRRIPTARCERLRQPGD